MPLACTMRRSFFFYCYVDHRDLHSFPTRRSSDLVCQSNTLRFFHNLGKPRRDHTQLLGNRQLKTRSEEHTSELQSRRDLVCRLLLEKKNSVMMEEDKKEQDRNHMGLNLCYILIE